MTKAPKRPRDLSETHGRYCHGRIERLRARGQSNDFTKGPAPLPRTAQRAGNAYVSFLRLHVPNHLVDIVI